MFLVAAAAKQGKYKTFKLTTFLETTRERQATWWDTETTTHNMFTIEVHPLCPTRSTPHLSLVGEDMLPGIP